MMKKILFLLSVTAIFILTFVLLYPGILIKIAEDNIRIIKNDTLLHGYQELRQKKNAGLSDRQFYDFQSKLDGFCKEIYAAEKKWSQCLNVKTGDFGTKYECAKNLNLEVNLLIDRHIELGQKLNNLKGG